MSTHEQQITNNPTSAVRNTGGRNGPQGLEEPMSDEVLREMCDKNYHQLLPLIAEKMQKEKEQKDKLNAVKARLIYGEESGIKIRSREESHYSESKTPTARTEPRRRHGGSKQKDTQRSGGDTIISSKETGESTKDFMEKNKAEVQERRKELRNAENLPRVMPNKPTLGEVVALNHGQRKASSSWKSLEGGNKLNFKKGFKNKQDPIRTPDNSHSSPKRQKKFSLWKKESSKPHPQCTDECMQLRKQIDEMIKAGKLSQFIKELKQNDKPKAPKKGEASGKDKPLTILMIQPWERVAKPRITQSFSPETAMSFPPLREEDGTEGPMIIEVEMGGHFVHRVYIDGGASSEVLYEHCFIKLRKEIRDQMVPATTHLIGFSGETIWPLGQIALLVKIGDEVHSTSAWMNFMVIRSPSQHNAIIGRPGIRKIRAVPSTAHGMLKFPVEGGTVTLQSSRVIPMECAMISGPSIPSPAVNQRYDVSPPEHRGTPPEYPGEKGGKFTIRQKKRETVTAKEIRQSKREDDTNKSVKDRNLHKPMSFRFEAYQEKNNEAEYEALIAGLRIAEQMGVKNLQANVDSRLVANQVNGSYIAKESGMVQYLDKVKTLAKSFKEFSIKQIPRSENKKADALSKIAPQSFAAT
ncbi:reverse transcriptase domain-containing protein [Tanacetum coccineum]